MPFFTSRSMQTDRLVDMRMGDLITNLSSYRAQFVANLPFNVPAQINMHRHTINRLNQLGGAAVGATDPLFAQDIWNTLAAWQMNVRGAKLIPVAQLHSNLVALVPLIPQLNGYALEALGARSVAVGRSVWQAVNVVRPAATQSQLVAGSKALHHLFPHLIPPMDRGYTRKFFQFHAPQFQSLGDSAFLYIFERMAHIAAQIAKTPVSGQGWDTSLPKIIDNAIVGYVIANGSSQKFPQ